MTTTVITPARVGFLGKTWRRRIGSALIYITLTALSLLFLIPLAWLFLKSLMTLKQATAFPPEWLPNPIQLANYIKALKFWNFARSFRNTVIVTSAVMVGELLLCTLVAYGFARLRFSGRNFLFIVLMSTMMLPGVVTMVPLYILFSKILVLTDSGVIKVTTSPAHSGDYVVGLPGSYILVGNQMSALSACFDSHLPQLQLVGSS